MTLPFLLPASGSSSHGTVNQGTTSPSGSAIRSFASGVRIEGLVSSSKGGGGPAYMGQVFSMLNPSGNDLKAVTTRFDKKVLVQKLVACGYVLYSGYILGTIEKVLVNKFCTS
ncbi:uncharacterized protein LOC122021856 [Zingiber officinale]|uniref:uncharacterized protein LOC122021856 n=1 Tax=Zingiber officinale TaxID=94328 RepID=UPI001C4B7250|nr:uncharacterized protein LOC122021856 [Zingiber officinale]